MAYEEYMPTLELPLHHSEASSPDAHTHTACLPRDDAAFSPESVVAIISTLFLAIVASLSDI